jgi:guanylate kinase
LESQKVLENYYGTPRYFYSQAKNKNKDLILCIDVKGGMYLKRKQKNIRIVMIFISAPNAGELNRRLKKRVEKIESITERLKLAKKELQFSKYYDYVIVNQSIPLSVNILKNILLKGG